MKDKHDFVGAVWRATAQDVRRAPGVWLTYRQASELTSISARTLRRWVSINLIEVCRVNNNLVRLNRASLVGFLEKHKIQAVKL